MPSGILWEGKECVIGNGVVIDPLAFIEEIDKLEKRGIPVTPEKLRLSNAAHVVFPHHRGMDVARENKRGNGKIGTTGRGIGPAYADKVHRCGIRVNDLIQPERLKAKFEARMADLDGLLDGMDLPTLEETLKAYTEAGQRLAPYVTNTVAFLAEALRDGKQLLFEGAQGAYLDIDHGTFTFVTSSNTTAGGACTGSGVAPTRIDEIIGVCKAYTTRVGAGPCVTENAEFSARLHEMGREFGATTGRKRRCGWLDMVMLRYTTMVNGLTKLAITNLDGLDGLETVKLCVAYDMNGERLTLPPIDAEDWESCTPIYEEMPGWSEDISSAKCLADLPSNALAYLDRLSEIIETPIGIVSVGPDRQQTMVL
jgi:adenylosuccinate synthase